MSDIQTRTLRDYAASFPNAAGGRAITQELETVEIKQPVFIGAYDNGTLYAFNDQVSYQGSSWIARIATVGNPPPTLPTSFNNWWFLVAQKGDQGIQGDDGPPGPAGGVTSVGLTVPTGLQATPATITTSGTFAVTYQAGYQGYTGLEATKLAGIAAGATANTGTVTSVGMTVPTGLSVTPASITTSGTFAVTYTAGYQGYTTTEATKLSGITALADPTGTTMAGATAKTTPVDADTMPLNDSAASNALKKVTWANIKATLKTYFDTLYQGVNANLSAIAGLTSAADRLPYFTGSGTAAVATFTTAGRALIDDADNTAQRATLGLGTIATQAASAVAITGGSVTGITDITVADGGTGLSTLTANNVILGAGTSAPTFVAPGTTGNVLTSNGTTWTSAAAAGGALPTLILRDEQTANTAGATPSGSGGFDIRTVNTVDRNTISGASLASNVITLPAGTYEVEGSANAYTVGQHKCRLWNITDSASLLIGSSERSVSSGGTGTRSMLLGSFTIASAKTIRLEHACQTSTVSGYGFAAGAGVTEVYAQLMFKKVA